MNPEFAELVRKLINAAIYAEYMLDSGEDPDVVELILNAAHAARDVALKILATEELSALHPWAESQLQLITCNSEEEHPSIPG